MYPFSGQGLSAVGNRTVLLNVQHHEATSRSQLTLSRVGYGQRKSHIGILSRHMARNEKENYQLKHDIDHRRHVEADCAGASVVGSRTIFVPELNPGSTRASSGHWAGRLARRVFPAFTVLEADARLTGSFE